MRPLSAFVMVLLPASLASMTGCANLEVSKIPVAERAAGADVHEDGFRYYLTRPYVVVNKNVKLCERQTLVAADQTPEGATLISYLDGPHRGESVDLEHLAVSDPAKGAARALTPAELAAIRGVLADSTTHFDPAVVPAAAPADATTGAGNGAATPSTPSPGSAAPPTGLAQAQQLIPASDIQIMYLPDLDEQYAVKSKNFVSKSTFNLGMGEGSTLSSVSGSHDSTPVAIALLQTLDSIVDAAKNLEGNHSSTETTAAPPSTKGAKFSLTTKGGAYLLIETSYLKAGVYRLNKPWESDGPPATGCGLLAKMGLPVVSSLQLREITTK